MSKLNYANKVALNENPSVAAINKVQDSDLNSIKNAVNQNGNYTTTTAGSSNGQYYCTLEGTLSSGDIIKVNIPTNTLTSANATISVDGGTTYYNVVDINNNNIVASGLSGRNIDLVFNGTNFVSNLDIYSTNTEIKTNKIYGGKIVYRNYIKIQNPAFASTYTSKSVAHNIPNIDKVIGWYNWKITTIATGTLLAYFPFMHSSGKMSVLAGIDETNATFRSMDVFNANMYYFEGWIEYTKTTN